MNFNKESFISGTLGGFVIIAGFIILAFSILHLFDYDLSFNRVYINISNIEDSKTHVNPDAINKINLAYKKELLAELHKNKLILTPQEYTTNVVNYYNSLLLILSIMIAVFSYLSFIHLKNLSKENISEILESDDFKDRISDKLVGKVEGRINEDLQGTINVVNDLKNQISTLKDIVETQDDKTVEL